jgi:hypothetical protein
LALGLAQRRAELPAGCPALRATLPRRARMKLTVEQRCCARLATAAGYVEISSALAA